MSAQVQGEQRQSHVRRIERFINRPENSIEQGAAEVVRDDEPGRSMRYESKSEMSLDADQILSG